jgi:AcrR family transcriptional regulator
MAKNKRDIDRQLKQGDIETAACRQFLTLGYEATSMANVAAAAGVAPNTLYWYFANKDDLLIAVLDRLVNQALMALLPLKDKPLAEQLKWLLGEFNQANKLVSTVHARLEHSAAIREWHDRFHKMLDELLISHMVAKGMDRKKAALMATIGTFVVEGLMSHPHTAQQFDTVVKWLAVTDKS